MSLRLPLPLYFPPDPQQKADVPRTTAQIARIKHQGENRLPPHADPSSSHTSSNRPNGGHEHAGGFYARGANATA